jgi:predicted permease
MLVTGSFFEMLAVPARLGRTLAPSDDDAGGGSVVVLSHRGWEKLFATDPAVIGRSILVNGRPYHVVGVMPEDFRGLRLVAPDYWAPLALIDQFRLGTGTSPAWVDVIGRLKPGLSAEAAAAALTAWASAQPDPRRPGNEAPQIALRPRRGVLSADRAEAMVAFTPIFFAFGLILLIGCANVANLLLARGLARQREIGVRLSLGATRRRVVRQLLTESLLLALAAAPIAYVLSRLLLTGGVHLALSLLPPEFAESTDAIVPPGDWRVGLFLFAGALLSTVLFGLVPALHSTRLELVRSMRGEVTRDSRPGRVRHVLIGAQVTASTLLLVSAAVFLRSTLAAAAADAGVRTDDTVIVSGMTENIRPAMLQAIREHPEVRSAAAAWPGPTGEGAYAEARAGATNLPVGYKLVSPEYFDLLGITVVRGRLFAREERDLAAGVVVISESVAKGFWPAGDALGQPIRVDSPVGSATRAEGAPRFPAQVFTVVGIVRDVRSPARLFDLGYNGVYLPTSVEQPRASLVLRVRGNPEATRRTLLDALTRIDPALGAIATMKMMARLETSILRLAFWMAVILGGLALALTVSGLFSVLSYLVEQRRGEIGVRMALGAATRDVVRLVVSQSLRPIAAGVMAGGALALGVAIVLLSTPAAAMIGSLVRAFDPIAYAASLGVIAATCLTAAFVPALRAARIDPITTLRAE